MLLTGIVHILEHINEKIRNKEVTNCYNRLLRCVAIPILVARPIIDYKNIASYINELLNENLVIVIPARKNSKRLKNKNFKDFHGFPLFEWSVAAGLFLKQQLSGSKNFSYLFQR